MIAWGLLDCFVGYRVFKVTVTIMGALTGVYLGFLASVPMGLNGAWQIVAVVVGALLGGGLAFFLYLASVFIAGLLFGLAIGVLLFANYSHSLALIAGFGLGLVGGFVAVKVQKILLILYTALLGALRALLALMFFTEQLDWAFYLFQKPQQIPALIDNKAWLLPATVVLAAAGVFTQLGIDHKSAGKKDRADGGGKRK